MAVIRGGRLVGMGRMAAPAAAAAKVMAQGALQIPVTKAEIRPELRWVRAAAGPARSVYPAGAVFRVRVAMG